MKYVSTARTGHQLVIPQEGDKDPVVIGRAPVEVSNEAADEYAKLGDSLGVPLTVSDEKPAERNVSTGSVTPDLSAGVGAVTGGGAPVTNTDAGVQPVGDDGSGNEPSAGTARTTSKEK